MIHLDPNTLNTRHYPTDVEVACPKCGSANDLYEIPVNEGSVKDYQFQCHACDAWFKATISISVDFDAVSISAPEGPGD